LGGKVSVLICPKRTRNGVRGKHRGAGRVIFVRGGGVGPFDAGKKKENLKKLGNGQEDQTSSNVNRRPRGPFRGKNKRRLPPRMTGGGKGMALRPPKKGFAGGPQLACKC